MGYITRAAFQRETGRTLHEVDKLLSAGLPHEVVGRGRGSEVRIDRTKALTWLVGLALSTVSGEPDETAPEIVQQRARLYREQADNVALKNQVARGELLPAGEVISGWQAAIGRSRALLLGIPTALAARLVLSVRGHGDDAEAAERAVREQLIRAIDAALTELANTVVEDPDDYEPAAADAGSA